MNALAKSAWAAVGLMIATQAAAQVTFYEYEGFGGRSFTANGRVSDMQRYADPASSAVVTAGRWEVCEGPQFTGRCIVLRQGQYPSLSDMGMDTPVYSVRSLRRNATIEDDRYAPAPLVSYDYRRRPRERLYQAQVTSVHAVLGPPEQRCWVEREQFVRNRDGGNVPGALFGAVIGGILGHQIGGGRGKDLATIGGAVAGAAVGSRVGHDDRGRQVITRDVQRCATVPSQAEPDYWDVTYVFRGEQYNVQMTSPPGPTITVNRRGEPRA
jgi:uncharacterized protein YcfJ